MSHLPRRIVAAAIKITKGANTGLVICGVRHFDQLMIGQLEALGYKTRAPEAEQGFVDNDYKFLDREQAWNVANFANQIHFISGTMRGVLHSEDLW